MKANTSKSAAISAAQMARLTGVAPLKSAVNYRPGYKIVFARTAAELETQVNDWAAEGWQLQGGVAVCSEGYAQALLRNVPA